MTILLQQNLIANDEPRFLWKPIIVDVNIASMIPDQPTMRRFTLCRYAIPEFTLCWLKRDEIAKD